MRGLGSRPVIGIIAFVAGASAVGGIAYAATPDTATGAITACYPTSGASKGALRVVDAQAGARCGAGQAILAWPSRGFEWRGEWTGASSYGVNDVVRYLGATYIAVKANTLVAPTNTTSWALMTSAGATGAAGHCGGFPHVGIDWSLPGSTPGHGCDFTGARLDTMNLTNANLTNANFANATFVETELAGADISGANLNADLSSLIPGGGITGTPAVLPPNWTLTGGWLIGPNDNLNDANLSGLDLTGADFYAGLLNGADLSAANLTNANLTSIDAENVNLAGAILTGANLTGAYVVGADVTGVIWSNTTCPDGTKSNVHGNTCAGHLANG